MNYHAGFHRSFVCTPKSTIGPPLVAGILVGAYRLVSISLQRKHWFESLTTQTFFQKSSQSNLLLMRYLLTARVLCCLMSSSDIDCSNILISRETSLSVLSIPVISIRPISKRAKPPNSSCTGDASWNTQTRWGHRYRRSGMSNCKKCMLLLLAEHPLLKFLEHVQVASPFLSSYRQVCHFKQY